MFNPFSWISGKIVAAFRSDSVRSALDSAVKLVPKALPIVADIAAMTPTRSDDEILALFTRFGMPYVDQYIALPVQDRGVALAKVATAQLKQIAPAYSSNIIDTAVQLAVTAYKADPKAAI
jgi:hypothetical protein